MLVYCAAPGEKLPVQPRQDRQRCVASACDARFHGRETWIAPTLYSHSVSAYSEPFRFTGRTMDSHDTFPRRVWQIVASIPQGYVATYGDIARLAGSPVRRARLAGSSSACLKAPRFPGTGWSIATATFPLLARICSASARRCWLKVSGVRRGHIDLQHYRWIY